MKPHMTTAMGVANGSDSSTKHFHEIPIGFLVNIKKNAHFAKFDVVWD
jgi:hypothetical protein